MVLHHSEAGWHGSVAFEALLDLDPEALAAMAEHIPRFRFVLDDISAESDEALQARAMTALGRLVLWCFRHARQPEELLRRLSRWREVVREVREAPRGRDALALVWRYILAINDLRRPEDLVRQLLRAAGPDAKEEMVSVADWLEERGRLRGLDQGRLEGQRSLLLKQLSRRFGPLPEAASARIQGAEAPQIETWAERVLTAATLAEVLGE